MITKEAFDEKFMGMKRLVRLIVCGKLQTTHIMQLWFLL